MTDDLQLIPPAGEASWTRYGGEGGPMQFDWWWVDPDHLPLGPEWSQPLRMDYFTTWIVCPACASWSWWRRLWNCCRTCLDTRTLRLDLKGEEMTAYLRANKREILRFGAPRER